MLYATINIQSKYIIVFTDKPIYSIDLQNKFRILYLQYNHKQKDKLMIAVDKNICPHNHICPLVKKCPAGAITQDKDGYPAIDKDLCIECGLCVKSCPMKAMKKS